VELKPPLWDAYLQRYAMSLAHIASQLHDPYSEDPRKRQYVAHTACGSTSLQAAVERFPEQLS
jgi:hypothetical protein